MRSKRVGCVGRRAEREAARRLGAQPVVGSGSTPIAKGDLRFPEFLVEAKATRYRSLSIKLDWLLTIHRQALEAGREPALLVQFLRDVSGRPVELGSWVMIPESVWELVKERVGVDP